MSEYTQERLRSLLYRTQKKKGPLMPPPVYPVTIDDNLVFLWRAIQHSNYTKIDFNLLGNDFELDREEALECFRELRRAIEDAVYNNYMEKSNEKRESAGPTNILGLAVRRRKEAAEGKYDGEEYAEDEASHDASAKGDYSAGDPKADFSNADTSKTVPTITSHQSSGSSKQVSSVFGQSTSGVGPLNTGESKTGLSNAGRPKTVPSSAGASQSNARSSNGGHLNASHPNASRPSAPPSNVVNANISILRAAPFNSAPSSISLNASHQSTGHTNAARAVNNPTLNSEAGHASESVKLAPIRASQTVNLPLPRLTNPASLSYSAGSSVSQPPNVGSLTPLPPSTIPAPGPVSGPQIFRSPTVPAMNYIPACAATVSAATSLTSMMIPQAPQAPQPSNQASSQTEDGPVVLDITSLRCFFGVVDQGVGPTSLNDKLFSRPDFFFPIRTPTLTTPCGPDSFKVNESQTQAPRPSLPSLSSLHPVPCMLAGRASSPATLDKGKKRKRTSGSRSDVEEDHFSKVKNPAQ